MREAGRRGETLHLTSDELAFYDALEVNDGPVKVFGDDTLKTIARELVETVRRNVTIDWTVRESVRAKLCVIVKRIHRTSTRPPRTRCSSRQSFCRTTGPSRRPSSRIEMDQARRSPSHIGTSEVPRRSF